MSPNTANDEDSSLQDDMSKYPPNIASNATSSANSNRRLGIFQLGIHAHEKTAPSRSLRLMTTDTAIRIPHIIPIIAKASEQHLSVKATYLCHPSIQYITKEKSEGSFCGYRNIQMLISYIIGSNATNENEGKHAFADGIPSILRIQDLIETAWDMGINSNGRIETGGIRETRKHIGTPEAQALFKSLGIPCSVGSFVRGSPGVGDQSAFSSLLEYVESHFTVGSESEGVQKVYVTDASPVYLQRPHHSLTIVGIEICNDGKRKLLILDPQMKPSRALMRATKALTEGATADEQVSLKEFRKGRWDLGFYKQFETLSLQG